MYEMVSPTSEWWLSSIRTEFPVPIQLMVLIGSWVKLINLPTMGGGEGHGPIRQPVNRSLCAAGREVTPNAQISLWSRNMLTSSHWPKYLFECLWQVTSWTFPVYPQLVILGVSNHFEKVAINISGGFLTEAEKNPVIFGVFYFNLIGYWLGHLFEYWCRKICQSCWCMPQDKLACWGMSFDWVTSRVPYIVLFSLLLGHNFIPLKKCLALSNIKQLKMRRTYRPACHSFPS